MTTKQEIRAKSMELALAFMGLVSELPITNDFDGYEKQELDRAFEWAVSMSRRFENFILTDPPDPSNH
jgi:hypothetical protein